VGGWPTPEKKGKEMAKKKGVFIDDWPVVGVWFWVECRSLW